MASHTSREIETKTELEEGRKALAETRDHLVKLNEIDKALEKNFKKEFPGFNYNQLEALLKCYRRRPKAPTGIIKTIDIFSKRDSQKKALAGKGKTGKHLKTKSIAATLERVIILH